MPIPPRTTTLVFDAFAHLPKGEPIVVAWPQVLLDHDLLEFASDLADGVGYLGRAESWTECEATAAWDVGEANCEPVFDSLANGSEHVSVIAPVSPEEYSAQRKRLIDELEAEVCDDVNAKQSKRRLGALQKAKQKRFGPTLPERLADALSLDSTDYRKFGWSTPPASKMVSYRRINLSPGCHATLSTRLSDFACRPEPDDRSISVGWTPKTSNRECNPDWRDPASCYACSVWMGRRSQDWTKNPTCAQPRIGKRRIQPAAKRRSTLARILDPRRCGS